MSKSNPSSFKYWPVSIKVNRILDGVFADLALASNETVTTRTLIVNPKIPSTIVSICKHLGIIKEVSQPVDGIRMARLEVYDRIKREFYDQFLKGIKK